MANTFKSRQWRVSYKTSSVDASGRPISVLRDFYIPALQLSVRYDRMAGYFRSSSLAAASEGYTALLNKENSHIRLIVGADLTVQDVQAILDGDAQRLESELLGRLAAPEDWEEAAQDGVSLLGAMIAAGKLEVRVALRRHISSGVGLAIDDTSDGYVHEKWFVIQDEAGNRIGCDGSLNESRTALSVNAENIAVSCDWKAETDAERIDEHEQSFQLLWENRHPAFRVLPLPVAVRERLIHIAGAYGRQQEIDERLRKLRMKPSAIDLLRFAVLKDAPLMPGGEFIGLYSAPVLPWPHQEVVSRRLIETWPYSWLMCDEVGLGKTIEAALAMRSLYLSGKVKRILIAAPKSVTRQWHRELHEKAMLSFALTTASPKITHEYTDGRETVEDKALFSPALNIISTGLLAREKHEASLGKSQGYDIALVDEAHYARRSNPRDGTSSEGQYGRLYRAIDRTLREKAASLWLATATPMQIDPVETWDLLRLTKRAGSFQEDASLTMAYYNSLGKLMRDEEVTPEEWRFLGACYAQIQRSDPYLWNLLQSTSAYNSSIRKLMEQLPVYAKPIKRADIRYVKRPLFSASPLSRVMMRHTRGLLEEYRNHGKLTSNLAHRNVLPLPEIHFTVTEKALYDMLEEYCAELRHQIQSANENAKTMMGFLLNFMQLRFASSMAAIKLTLERRLKKVETTLLVGAAAFESQEALDQRLAELAADDIGLDEQDLEDIDLDVLLKDRTEEDLRWERDALRSMLEKYNGMAETPSKIQYLLNKLSERLSGNGRMRQTVVFTRFLDSLRSIREYLKVRSPGLRVGVYSGQETYYFNPTSGRDENASRDEIKQKFISGEIDLLLCTDAAAEGLNLQTADLLINFDLGWNPMKIEQRIGRIDRIGQKYTEIYVLNMCYIGSVEEVVYGRLWERLQKAGLVVGKQQISLLPVDSEDFERLREGKASFEEIAREAEEKIKEQIRMNASMEISPAEQYSMYQRASQSENPIALPATLDSFWDALQKARFIKPSAIDEKMHTWHSEGTEDYPALDGTTDRDNATEEIPLLTWGNPSVERFLTGMTDTLQTQYPNCTKRIEITIGSTTKIAWLVAAKDGQTKVIERYSDLQGIEIDENAVIEQETVHRETNLLRRRIETAIERQIDSATVRRYNADLAYAERFIINLLACELLDRQIIAGETAAVGAIKALEDALSDYCPPLHLPWNASEFIQEKYVFTCQRSGQNVDMIVTQVMYLCALDRMNQALAVLAKNKKKSLISTEELAASIRRKKGKGGKA